MPRYKITIEYDGTGLVGWQRQENGASIQGALEEAIGKFCGEQVTVHGAGRTDAGVHALGQVAHFDLAREAPVKTVREALNAHLRPAAIAVLEAQIAPEDFNARFDAIRRHYRYRILNRRAPPVLERGQVWHVIAPLEAKAMHEAAQLLIGEHDFTTFRATECQAKSPVKTLEALSVSRLGEEIEFTVRARSFLHHQVRNFAGTLKLVGEGKWTKGNLADALAARDRARGGPTAPGEGLCLIAVDYP